MIGTLPVTSSDAKVPLQLIMAKTRHKNLRTAMRYIKPGGEAGAEITRHSQPIPPQALRAFPACTLYISAGQRLLR